MYPGLTEEISEEQERVDDSRNDSVFGKKEIRQIQRHIAATTRPSWHVSPPPNFGTPTHGKLKADQWRSCIEFDLPVSMVQLWSGEPSGDVEDSRSQKLIEITMRLATAISWGTSHQTSPKHVAEYMENIHAYLTSLIELFPDITLRPNHHMALHLGEFFLRFGPVHGWWMFPFERVIGKLQRTKTNFKMGQFNNCQSKRD